jgi:choline-sulfatase
MTEDLTEKLWKEAGGERPVSEDIRTKPTWRPFHDPARVWLNADKLPFPRYYENMKSTWVVEQAKSFLRQHTETPFALWVSLQEPHSPYDFPVEDRADFAASGFPVPRVGPEDSDQIPLIFRGLEPEDKQGIIASYYTAVRYLDHNMGVVLSELRRLNLDRDTLVVYMADHGYCLGQHGRFEKHCCYEPAIVAPLIMRWTGRMQPRVIHEFTESVDVPPTILEMLGAEPFRVQHGQSLRPYLEGGRVAAPRESIFSEYLENEEACVRTERWKFVQCSGRRARNDGYITDNPLPGRYTRLYDVVADSGEFIDRSAEHPEVIAELSGVMLERFRSTHPDAASEPANLQSPRPSTGICGRATRRLQPDFRCAAFVNQKGIRLQIIYFHLLSGLNGSGLSDSSHGLAAQSHSLTVSQPHSLTAKRGVGGVFIFRSPKRAGPLDTGHCRRIGTRAHDDYAPAHLNHLQNSERIPKNATTTAPPCAADEYGTRHARSIATRRLPADRSTRSR